MISLSVIPRPMPRKFMKKDGVKGGFRILLWGIRSPTVVKIVEQDHGRFDWYGSCFSASWSCITWRTLTLLSGCGNFQLSRFQFYDKEVTLYICQKRSCWLLEFSSAGALVNSCMSILSPLFRQITSCSIPPFQRQLSLFQPSWHHHYRCTWVLRQLLVEEKWIC